MKQGLLLAIAAVACGFRSSAQCEIIRKVTEADGKIQYNYTTGKYFTDYEGRQPIAYVVTMDGKTGITEFSVLYKDEVSVSDGAASFVLHDASEIKLMSNYGGTAARMYNFAVSGFDISRKDSKVAPEASRLYNQEAELLILENGGERSLYKVPKEESEGLKKGLNCLEIMRTNIRL